MSEQINAEERLAVFKKMLEADPDNELAHLSLGRIYVESHDLQNAEKSLRRVLDLAPRHSLAHVLLGQVLAESDRKEDAIELLVKGVHLAHEKGEYQPRNQMQALLRTLGVDPPDPIQQSTAKPEGAAEGKIFCQRCGSTGEPLEEAPFENNLGAEIREKICQNCWREWIGMSVKVINEYRLDLSSDEGSQIFDFHMKEFLGLQGEQPAQE